MATTVTPGSTEPSFVVEDKRPRTPSRLNHPCFLLNFPFSFAADEANNSWMQDLPAEKRNVDFRKAAAQFLDLYEFLAAESLVYILPTPKDCHLQDLVFTANIGVTLAHEPLDTVILSNFATKPRVGEELVAMPFFESMGYTTVKCPYLFEGEAELKHLHDNVYVGGYGQRSEQAAYDWMAEHFGMKIIMLEETDPYLYHLDCTIFPLTREKTVVCTKMLDKKEVKALERETEIIDVSVDDALYGVCNSLRLGNLILNASHLRDLTRGTEEYNGEKHKNQTLEDIALDHAFEAKFFNLSEYHKGGALLSCMVLHLNRRSYDFSLV